MTLAGVNDIFDQTKIDQIATNLYALIGLVVVFRVAFILLNVIVNPDKLNDKQSGVSKILTKFVIALVLIVAIPIAFDLSRQI
jgi:hypothetical protein